MIFQELLYKLSHNKDYTVHCNCADGDAFVIIKDYWTHVETIKVYFNLEDKEIDEETIKLLSPYFG